MNSLQQKISNNYGDSPKRLLTHLWFVCLGFGFIHVLVAISVAAVNNQVNGGSKGAIWSLFIVISFCAFGSHMVFKANPPVILIGFVIGMSFMLSQLFFVLVCVFFTLGSHAKTNKIGTEQANNAFGVFSFFNMLVFAIWACILSYHRSVLSIKSGTNSIPSLTTLAPNTTTGVNTTQNNSSSNYLTSFFTTTLKNEKNNHNDNTTSAAAPTPATTTANVMINDDVELESIKLDDSQSKHTTPSS